MEYTVTFIEKLVDNLPLYTEAIQKQVYQELEEILTVSISKNKTHRAQFQGNSVRNRKFQGKKRNLRLVLFLLVIYFLLVRFWWSFVLETHPIISDLWGNGNWIIVRSKSSVALWQWVLKRLNNSRVKETCTPFFMKVELW